MKWSPDGMKVSYILREENGERGTLHFVDATTGRGAVLVSSDKLSLLAPSPSGIKNERK